MRVSFAEASKIVMSGLKNGDFSNEEIAEIAYLSVKSLYESDESIKDSVSNDYYGIPSDYFEDRVEDYSNWIYKFAEKVDIGNYSI